LCSEFFQNSGNINFNLILKKKITKKNSRPSSSDSTTTTITIITTATTTIDKSCENFFVYRCHLYKYIKEKHPNNNE
jgi:hypothetical protein